MEVAGRGAEQEAALGRGSTSGRRGLRPTTAQFLKFGLVGASGYVVNLAVYAALVHGPRLHFGLAATCSFLVAVTNNYVLNRAWTFRDRRGAFAYQGMRFLVVAVAALCANVLLLAVLIGLGLGDVPAQATAILLVAPLNFFGNKAWTFARSMPAGAALPRVFGPRNAVVRFVDREAYVVPLVALYALALARLAPYELVQDSWLTLLSGREIVEGGLPGRDHLTVFTEDARWIDQQWLAQLALYGLFVLGGLKGALVAHVILLTAGFALALTAARRLGASPRSVFWVGIASFLLAPWTWQMRAQSFVYVLFVAVLWLLVRDAREPSRQVYLVFPLLVLWANLHGSVALAVVLVAARAFIFVWEQLRADRRRPGWGAKTAVLLGAAPLCLLASPYGTALVGYYHDMLLSPEFARIVGEWRPPTFTRAAPFFVLAVAAVWLLARAGPRLTGFEKLAVLITILGGFTAIRSITWFALAGLVVLPVALDEAWPAKFAFRPPGFALRTLARLGAVALPAAVIGMALVPTSTYERLWPEQSASAVSRAAAEDPSLRVFASERYGDWLIWKDPALRGRVAFDVRFELHSSEQLDALFAYHNRVGADWWHPASGYRLLVFDRKADGALEREFPFERETRRLYRDPLVGVYLRPN